MLRSATLKSPRTPVYVAAAAFAVSQLGDHLLAFALALRSAELGRPSATVLVFLADLMPAIAFGSLVGRFVDRHRIGLTVVTGIAMQAALACVLALITSLAIQIVILFFMASAGLVSGTGAQVMLGRLGDKAGRQWTDSAASFAMTAATAIAPALGGLIYAAVKIRGVGLINAATFVVMAVAVLAVLPAVVGDDARPSTADVSGDVGIAIRRRLTAFASATVDGVKLYRSSSLLRVSMPLILMIIFSTCLEGVAGVYYLRTVAGGRPYLYGFLLASWSVGATAGSLLTADRLRVARGSSMLGIGAALIGVGLCLAGGIAIPLTVSVAFLVGGLGNGIFNTAIRTVINEGAPSNLRGTAWGTFRTLSSFVIGLGLVLGAPGLILPARQMVIVAGALPILALAVFLRVGRGTQHSYFGPLVG